MPKALPAVLVLALACLATLCTAFPSVAVAQTAFAATEPIVPRTLLGRPYRRRLEGTRSCPRAHSTIVLADCNDVEADSCSYPDPNVPKTQMKTGTSPKQRTQPPLPLVLNMFPEATRWTRPMSIPCIKGVCAWTDTITRGRGDKERQTTSRVECTLQGNVVSRQTSVPTRRSKRSWGRKEWKPHELEEV